MEETRAAHAVTEITYEPMDRIAHEAIANGLRFSRLISYPSEATVDDLPTGHIEYQSISTEKTLRLLRTDQGLIEMKVGEGFFYAYSYAESDDAAQSLIKFVSEKVPHSELDTDEINVTFWTLGQNGPIATSRKVTCPQWADVEGNYTASTRTALEELMAAKLDESQGGKLVLWHGPPGTGKTYALRAWSRMMREEMEVHYIVDPEVFFGEKATYMVSVLLGSDTSPSDSPKWRLIVAEDTGELLTKDAKHTTGQSLSRLLNVCDGLIGQGLRSLVLVTTNEELGALHDAVTRPGRCLANIGFDDLVGEEVEAWIRTHDAAGVVAPHVRATVAALYAELKESKPITTKTERKVGFAV